MLFTVVQRIIPSWNHATPWSFTRYFFLSLCLFLSGRFPAVRGIWLESTQLLFKRPYCAPLKWIILVRWRFRKILWPSQNIWTLSLLKTYVNNSITDNKSWTFREREKKWNYLCRFCHIKTELNILAHEIHVEGVVIFTAKNVGTGSLPQKGISGRCPYGMPKQFKIHIRFLCWNEVSKNNQRFFWW